MAVHNVLRLAISMATVFLSRTVSADSFPQCPSTVSSILSSSLYTLCQQHVAEILESAVIPSWIFTVDNSDYLHSSEACMTAIYALQAIDFTACETSLAASGSTTTTARVTLTKSAIDQIDQIAMPCRARHLRETVDRLTRALTDNSTTSYDWTFVYVGLAISLALSLFCCAFDAWVRRNHRVAREQSMAAAYNYHATEKSGSA